MSNAGTLTYASDEPIDNLIARDEEGLHVLIVEDDAADAYLIRRALAKNPYVGSIINASDGMQALRAIDDCGVLPDVAIIDLHMPRMDGFRLLVELGCRPQHLFPKIVLTSSIVKGDQVRSMLRGADCVLSKPDTLKELALLLNDALERVPRTTH